MRQRWFQPVRKFRRQIILVGASAALVGIVFHAARASTPRAQGSASAAAKPDSSSPAIAQPAEKLTLAGVPNAGRINQHLYRGAQPKPQGFEELRKLGIGIVVDLHNTGSEQENERREVESLGMHYVAIPLSSTHRPSDAQTARFLKILRYNPSEKVFVHCNLGADRTGVMIGAYRMAVQNWTPQQTMNEMRAFHFHHLWLPYMISFVNEFPKKFSADPVFAPLHPATPSSGQ